MLLASAKSDRSRACPFSSPAFCLHIFLQGFLLHLVMGKGTRDQVDSPRQGLAEHLLMQHPSCDMT